MLFELFLKHKRAIIAFRSVEIDMDKCADCTKRDAQSAAKLDNQTDVHGTRVCGINDCLFSLFPNKTQSDENLVCFNTVIWDTQFAAAPLSLYHPHRQYL